MKKRWISYLLRFTLLYAVIYWVVGAVSYELFGYQEALESMEYFALWRDLNSSAAVAAMFMGTILRSIILALLLYPFVRAIFQQNYGWLALFGVFFGLTTLGSFIFIPNNLQELLQAPSLGSYLSGLKTGLPEIVMQILLFSWLFFYWERRARNRAATVKVD